MSDITINIDGKKYALDDFSLGDLEWFEEEWLGKPLTDPNAINSMKAAVGFVYLVKRQDDPSFTIEQARALKLGVIEGSDDETEPKAKRPPKRAART